MKIIERPFGQFTKDDIRYNFRSEDGDTMRPRQYAIANGYILISIKELRLEQVVNKKKKEIASARYTQEMLGFQLPIEQGGMFVRSDPRTRTLMGFAAVKAMNDSNYEVLNWKTAEGEFITLTNETILFLNDALHDFISGCFEKEAQLVVEINTATTVEEVEAINW